MKKLYLLFASLLFSISLLAQPCNQPTNLRLVAYSSTTLSLDWTSGGASNWQIRFVLQGNSIAGASRINVTNKPFTITGLTANTTYSIQVRDSCGSSSTSAWSPVSDFSTSCAPLSAPLTENFDGSDWTIGAFNSAGTIDNCWKRIPNQNINTFWKPGPPFFTTSTGADADHTSGSGQYIYTETTGFTFTADSSLFESPLIELSSLTSPQLVFWYHMFGSDIEELRTYVSVDSGLTYTLIDTLVGQQQSSSTDAWKERILNLNAFANQTVRIRFMTFEQTAGFNDAVCIDDFEIREAPSCPRPQSLRVTNKSSNSITLSWISGGASNWQIEYGSPGFALGNGTLINAANQPFTVTGLNANTGYEFYVRDSCGPGDVSVWAQPVIDTTLCLPVTAPYTEDFDGSNFNSGGLFNGFGSIDPCWNRDISGNYFWKAGPPPFTPFNTGPDDDNTPGNAGGYLFTESIGFGGNTRTTAETPLIDLSPLTNPQLTFYVHMFGSNIDNLRVLVNNGSGFSAVTTISGQQQNNKTAAWKEIIVPLGSYVNDTVQISFEANRTLGVAADIAIDDIEVDEAPSCPKPQNLAIQSIGSNSVTLNWLSGGASNWNFSYGSPGTAAGAGTIVNSSSNPGTITGLTANTIYEVYVRDSCAPGDVSDWVGPVVFRTRCNPVSAPFSEDFEGTSFTTGTFLTLGNLDPCWSRDTAVNYVWEPVNGNNGTNLTGPNNDHTTGSGKYLLTDNVFLASQSVLATEVSSVTIDLSPLTDPELSFWYHTFGTAIDSLEVLVDDGQSRNSVFVSSGPQQTGAGSAWLEAIVDLNAYANDTIALIFRGVRSSAARAEIAIDDVKIDEKPTCPKPQNFSLLTVNSNSATLDWTSGGASNWNLSYGSPGTAASAGTIITVSSSPASINGLSPNTNYVAYVRDSCGPGDVSDWVGPINFRTRCSPVSAPYTENFDGSTFSPGSFFALGSIDPCWQRDTLFDFIWDVESGNNFTTTTGPDADHTSGSGQFLFTELTFGGVTASLSTELSSVPVDLSPLNVPELTFWYHLYGSAVDSLEVWVDDGQSRTRVLSLDGQKQNSESDPWIEAIVSLSAYANDTVSIIFRGIRNSGFSRAEIAIDDFTIQETPTCPKPQNFTNTATTNNSVTLSWTSGGASNWQIEYGSPGFSVGSGTLVTANSNPFSVSGLSASTTYEFYVRDSCGPGDLSAWTGPLTARTDCAPVTAPYSEDFEGGNFSAGSFFNPGTIDPCWSRDSTSDFIWETLSGNNFTTQSGPDNDHTTGSGQYLATDRVFGSATSTNSTELRSPRVDLSSLTNPELSFWYHLFATTIDSLIVLVDDGSSQSIVFSLIGDQQNAASDPWQEAIISLSAYANDTINLIFRGSRTSFSIAEIAIDDLSIDEAPTCPKPRNFSVQGVSTNSATLGWTSGGANDWNISYGSPGTAAGAGTVVNITNNPVTLSGLSANTPYEAYVRDSCGPGDVSDWVGPISFRTKCSPVTAPYTEDFEGPSFTLGTFTTLGNLNPCWSRDSLGNYVWDVEDGNAFSTQTGPLNDHTTGSGKYLLTDRVFGFFGTTLNTELVSEVIDLSALTAPELSFWYHMYGSDIDSLEVFVDDGVSRTSVFTRVGQQQSSQTAAWKEALVNLTAYANDTITLIFRGVRQNNSAAEIAIDDINIDEAPSCPKPRNFAFTARTDSSITLSWTSGGATNWQIEYGPSGFTQGNGTLLSVSNNPATINGLSASTAYQFYVRDSCGPADTSDWVGPLNARTDCGLVAAPYTENFDGTNFTPPISFAQQGNIDPCWSTSDTTGYFWRAATGVSPVFNSGPSQDNTTGTGQYLISIVSSSFNAGQSTTITSPRIDLSPLTNPELRFHSHLFGPDIDELVVAVNDGSGWTNELTISGQVQTAQADPWREEIVNLNSYANDTIQVRFEAKRASGFAFQAGISIDDFIIREQPSCPKPSSLTSTAVSNTSITLSWTSGGATNWYVNYRVNGSGAPFTRVVATTNPFTLNGLNASTTYEITVQDSCGLNDVSQPTTPISVTTNCGVVNFPYLETFDGSQWVPGSGFGNSGSIIDPCWSRPNSNNPNFSPLSGPTGSFGTGPDQDFSGNGKYLYTEGSGGVTGQTGEITSPRVAVPSASGTPYLKFAYHLYGSDIGTFEIEARPVGGSYSSLFSLTGQQQTSNTAPWRLDSVDLSSYQGDTIEFRFSASNNGFRSDAAFDQFELFTSGVPCDTPGNISFSNVGPDSLVVSWSSTNTGASTTISYYDQSQGPGTAQRIFNATSPALITGLNPGTNYVIGIVDSCGNNNLSGSAFDTVATAPCPPVTAAFNFSRNILSVSFDGSGSVNADSLRWLMGNGNIRSGQNVQENYALPGVYPVTLIAFNICGDSDTLTQNVTVCDTLTAKFTAEVRNDTAFFDADSSENAVGYLWDLDDGINATGKDTSVIYANSGTKTITLRVYNNCGDTLALTKTIDVCPSPTAIWNYTTLPPINTGLRLQFDGTQSIGAVSYNWDFGDGNTATGPQPIHIYATPGLFYEVTLTVTNACGGQDQSKLRLNEVSLDELIQADELALYPNPTRKELTLQFNAQRVQIQGLLLMNSAGQAVADLAVPFYQKQSEVKMMLSLPDLPPGTYWLAIQTQSNTLHKPVVIR